MWTATQNPSVNWGYTCTIVPTSLGTNHNFMPRDCIFLPRHTGTVNDAPSPGECGKKRGAQRLCSNSLRWDSCHITSIFTQLIYGHLQLVQTGNVRPQTAETRLQNKPRESNSIQWEQFIEICPITKMHRTQSLSHVCIACSRVSLLL